MNLKLTSIFLIVLLAFEISAQEKYLIFFKDKGESDKTYFKKSLIENELLKSFSPKAIERRKKVLNDNLFLYGDYPIYNPYINAIENLGVKIINKLNWFNAVSCYLDENQKEIIQSFEFVEKIEKVKFFKKKFDDEILLEVNLPKITNDYGNSFTQLNLSEIPAVHSKGITGENVIIGLLDSGFKWKTHEAIENTNVIAEYDFVFQDSVTANDTADHPSQDIHGTMILGIIAGKKDGKLYGVSYNSKYILAKTEDVRSERRIEEDNYAAALEWMERLGVDVTSSSLGYSEFDDPMESYTYQDMNGRTTIVARAVDSAFVRGVVTVTAAGNEFNSPWKYIVSPADAYNVLAVGAVYSNGNIAGFSSRGPTSDGRIKPDVCAMGVSVYTVYPGTYGNYTLATGTSAATPIVAGIAGLLISNYSEIDQYQVRDIIRKTASQSNKPDTVYGWGIANAKKAVSYPVLISTVGSNYLYKTFVDSFVVDSVTVVLLDEDGINLSSRKMVEENEIKFKTDISDLDINKKYAFYFEVNSGGQRLRIPADDNLYYELKINSREINIIQLSTTSITSFDLDQNYPNPFISRTYFKFKLPVDDVVNFEIYDILGRRVRTILRNVFLSKGIYQTFYWDGRDDNGRLAANGIYLYRLKSNNFNQTKKMILLRNY